jgi:hypothetical protein
MEISQVGTPSLFMRLITLLQVLVGVSADDFSSSPSAQSSFISSVSLVMNISNTSVSITGIADVNVTRRSLRPILSPGTSRSLASSALRIDYAIEVSIRNIGFQDATAATSFLTNAITDSVSSGQFLTVLQTVSSQAGSNLLANITANPVTITKFTTLYTSAPPSFVPTISPSARVRHRMSNSRSSVFNLVKLIGIIVGACAALAVGAYTLYSRTDSVNGKVMPFLGASEGGVGSRGSLMRSPVQVQVVSRGAPDNFDGAVPSGSPIIGR